MKTLLLSLLLTCSYCFSQNANYYSINYELIRTKGQLVFNANGELKVDLKNNISEFKLSQYENLLKDGDKIINNQSKDTIHVLGSKRICLDDKIYYHNFAEKNRAMIIYDKYCKSKVLIKDTIEYPKWNIENEFKKIAGFNAQKATALIADRSWTVFFTNELKINGGPWKLIGLPGLILEAKENTGVYEFVLTEIKADNFEHLSAPKHDKTSTFDLFVKKSVERQTDEMYFRLSSMGHVDKSDFPLYETLDFIEKRD